jgi:thiol:disulfide interchange protein
LSSNILEGEVILLTEMALADSFSKSELRIGGDLRYLVCKEQCILLDEKLSLTLPVSKGGDAKPANADVFKQARRSLPKSSGKYVTVRPIVKAPEFAVGSKFDFKLAVDVARGHHVQSNTPAMSTFVATEIFLEPTPGVTIYDASYPKPHFREVKYLGKMSEFTGHFDITVPVEVDEAPDGEVLNFAGILKYQVCNDGGQCYPPTAIAFTHEAASQKTETQKLIEKAKKLAEIGGGLQWQHWQPGLAEQLSQDGHIVYVEVWADWCRACQTNREATTDTDEVRKLMDRLCVVPLHADYTHMDEEIKAYLQEFNRTGPPLAVFYPPNEPNQPILMPAKLANNPEQLLEALRSAGANYDCRHEEDDPSKRLGTAVDTDEADPVDYAESDEVDTAVAVTPAEGDDDAGAVPAETVDADAADVVPAVTGEEVDTEAALNGGISLITAIMFAFLGGLILNIMPCVLPVISIKILSFVQQAGEDPKRVFQLGLVFASGVVLSFLALAAVIIGLKHGGTFVSQGFHFQNPVVVIVLASIIFAFGLSLFGVFEVTIPGAAISQISAAEEREGALGAFLKGVLATILATPCTAPFLGSALGLALNPATSDSILVVIFLSAGFGMASPYIILTWKPAWLKFVPRPGAWMETFKQFMGFLLMGTVVFLTWPLKDLIGAEGLFWTLCFLTSLGLAVWILGLQTPLTPFSKRMGAWGLALVVVMGSWWVCFHKYAPFEVLLANAQNGNGNGAPPVLAAGSPKELAPGFLEPEEWEDEIPWRRWSKGMPEQLAQDGHTVFVDFTATWCLTCIANKKGTVDTPEVRQVMSDLCVIPLKADFTHRDPEIVEVLQKFGRGGVPLNVIYPAENPGKPIALPEQLIGRQDLVINKLMEAGSALACPNGPTGIGAITP